MSVVLLNECCVDYSECSAEDNLTELWFVPPPPLLTHTSPLGLDSNVSPLLLLRDGTRK